MILTRKQAKLLKTLSHVEAIDYFKLTSDEKSISKYLLGINCVSIVEHTIFNMNTGECETVIDSISITEIGKTMLYNFKDYNKKFYISLAITSFLSIAAIIISIISLLN